MADEYICDVCGRKFKSERGLATHKTKAHLIEKEHKCSYCGKGFSSAWGLTNHIRIAHFREEVERVAGEMLRRSLRANKKIQEEETSSNDEKEVKMAEVNETYVDKLLSMQRQTFEKELDVFKERLERVQDNISRRVEKEVEETVSQKMREITDTISRQIAELRDTVKSISEGLTKGTNGQKQLAEKLQEVSSKVSSLEEVATKKPEEITKVVEKVGRFEKKLQEIPTKEEVRSLIDECILDPNSKACARITELVSSKIEPAKEKDEDKIHIDHSTWDEVFQCPECIAEFSDVVSKHPEFLSKALSRLGERDKDALADVISRFAPKEEKKGFYF